MAEKYLLKVIEPNIAAKYFDDLRHVNYLLHPQQLKDTYYELTALSTFTSIFLIPPNQNCNQLILVGSSSRTCLFQNSFFVKCQKKFWLHVRARKDVVIVAVVRCKNKCVRNNASVKTAKICDNRIALRL